MLLPDKSYNVFYVEIGSVLNCKKLPQVPGNQAQEQKGSAPHLHAHPQDGQAWRKTQLQLH